MKTREQLIEAAANIMAARAILRPLESVAVDDVASDVLLWALGVPDACAEIDLAARVVAVKHDGRRIVESFRAAIGQMAPEEKP